MRKLLIAALIFACALALAIPGLSLAPADMIGGLRELARISPEEARSLPAPAGTVHLSINGVQLPYDAQSNTYFIPQRADGSGFDGEIEIAKAQGWKYYLCAEPDISKQIAIENSIGYRVYGVRGDQSAMAKLIFTSLPVISIATESGELPDEADGDAMLSVFTPRSGAIQLDHTPIEINLRGNTSKRLPKQSYRVKIVDEHGEKQNLSIAGLRSDDDWILNPLYSDTSKIREWLAYDLWDRMNSSGQAAASSRLEYVELFINGEYWGLYGVQERIDRKQLDADKRSGVIYKMIANDRPAPSDLLDSAEPEQIGGIKLEFSGAGVEDPWAPAAAYMALLSGEQIDTLSTFSAQNAIDYGLWAMLAQAHDCHFKNQFLNCVYASGGHIIYKIPWDLNNTFGDVWSDEAGLSNYTDHYVGSFVYDCVFELLIESGDEDVLEAVKRRWAELRSGDIQMEEILRPAREKHRQLFPAIQRDSRRWPECGMGEGNLDDISDIEAYLQINLPDMDAYIESL